MTLLNEYYNKLNRKFRNCWDQGNTAVHDGIVIFNKMVDCLRKNSSLTIKEIIIKILKENDDLVGLSYGKLILFLNIKHKNCYWRKL